MAGREFEGKEDISTSTGLLLFYQKANFKSKTVKKTNKLNTYNRPNLVLFTL